MKPRAAQATPTFSYFAPAGAFRTARAAGSSASCRWRRAGSRRRRRRRPGVHHFAICLRRTPAALLARQLGAGLLHHDQQRPLVPLRVLGRDAGGHRDLRVRHRDVLEVDRADPFAAGLDDVLAAVGDLHVAVGVDRGDVAGREPAVHERVAAFVLEVLETIHGPRTSSSPRDLAVPRQLLAVVADDLHVDAVDRAALLGLHRECARRAAGEVLAP